MISSGDDGAFESLTFVIRRTQVTVKQTVVCVHSKVIYVGAKAAVEDLGSNTVFQQRSLRLEKRKRGNGNTWVAEVHLAVLLNIRAVACGYNGPCGGRGA